MQPPEDDAAWDRQAAEARAAVQAWRHAHPQATLTQIEAEVDRQLAAARARLVEAVAVAGGRRPPRRPARTAAGRWRGTGSGPAA